MVGNEFAVCRLSRQPNRLSNLLTRQPKLAEG